MRPLPFNATEYERTRAPVVDTFKYSASDPDTGTALTVDLSPEFLTKTATTMNDKFERRGDLCPIVIGHTKTGAKEIDQPPKVGYLHNFSVEPFDGTPTLFADHYIKKQVDVPLNGVLMRLSAKELVERFPRRSGEIWFGTYEVDPHSLLGATTPHRSLGLLKLSADGKAGLAYSSPGELKVADNATEAPKTGEFAELTALVKQCLAMVGQLTEQINAALQPQEGAQPEGGDSLDDFMKSLDSEGGEKEKPKGDEKEKPEGGEKKAQETAPAEDAEKVKLARERDELAAKLARTLVTSRLEKAGADATDEALISDLIAQPEDIRERFLLRLERTAKPAGPRLPAKGNTGALNAAVSEATKDNGSYITTEEQKQKVIKLARAENLGFDQAAKKLGFKLPGE